MKPSKDIFPLDAFTGATRQQLEAMMDAYAEECLEQERRRLFKILVRLGKEDETVDGNYIINEKDLRKIILGNKK